MSTSSASVSSTRSMGSARRSTRSTGANLLSRALLGNALFSGLSGLALLVASGPLGGWLGVASPWILPVVGACLLVFAAGLLFLARAKRPGRGLVLAATASDFAWVAGSAVLLVGFPDLVSGAGNAAVAAVAVVVAGFGVAQLLGLRRAGVGARHSRG